MKNTHSTNSAWVRVLATPAVILVLCGAPSFVRAQDDVWDLKLDESGIPEGSMIVDGDIIVPIGTTAAAPFVTGLWPPGNPTIVPFMFDTDGNDEVIAGMQTAMLNAMVIWEALADVAFRARTWEPNFIWIRNSSNDTNPSNSSYVGMVGGPQVLNITSWGSQRVILHELGHALGFWHEHQRSDRNTFIQINCQNQIDGCCSGEPCDSVNYGFVNLAEYGPYDLGSIMHYGQCASVSAACSAFPGCPRSTACPFGGRTITVLPAPPPDWQNNIGTATAPSTWDALVMSFLYPEGNWRFLDNQCGHYRRGVPCWITSCVENGSFFCPWVDDLSDAVDQTPRGGTLWILARDTYSTDGTLSKRMTIRAPLGATLTLREE
jgi:hypothetical protein